MKFFKFIKYNALEEDYRHIVMVIIKPLFASAKMGRRIEGKPLLAPGPRKYIHG